MENAKKIDRPKQTLAPSNLIGEKTLQNTFNTSNSDAKELGKILHKILEFLPSIPKNQWEVFLNGFFESNNFGISDEIKDSLILEAIGLLENPTLAYIFFTPNGLSEVGITSHIPQLNNNILGYIDRLIIDKNTITAIDFKSNVSIPISDEEIPKGILAQQAVYLLALQKIYPTYEIIIAILWTKTGEVMKISHNTAINSLDVIQHLDDSIDGS